MARQAKDLPDVMKKLSRGVIELGPKAIILAPDDFLEVCKFHFEENRSVPYNKPEYIPSGAIFAFGIPIYKGEALEFVTTPEGLDRCLASLS